MKEAMEHLDHAFAFLSKIPVSGEAVDLLAMARQELRSAYHLLKEQENEKEQSDG